MLELSPDVESVLEREAAQAGMTVGALILSTFGVERRRTRSGDGEKALLDTSADDDKRAAVLAYIGATPEEVSDLHRLDIAHIRAKLAGAEGATPKEVEDAEAEWAADKAAVNASRHAAGERPVYAEAATLR